MSYRDVLRVFKLERELTEDETATLNTLRKMSSADIEATVEAFGGSMGKGKPVRATTTRNIEHCDIDDCGLTKRAAIHKDPMLRGFHAFLPPPPSSSKPKTPRASSIAERVQKKGVVKEPHCAACYEYKDHLNHDLDNGGHEFEGSVSGRLTALMDPERTDLPERCTVIRDDNKPCSLLPDHNVHHMQTAMGYHEFESGEVAEAAAGD